MGLPLNMGLLIAVKESYTQMVWEITRKKVQLMCIEWRHPKSYNMMFFVYFFANWTV